MKYKLLACDFDGTLYSDKFDIPSENIEALDKFREVGGKVIIATGRLFSAIYPQLEKLHINNGEIICHQGASIFDIETGKVKHVVELDHNVAIDALEFLANQDYKVIPLIFYNDEAYTYIHDTDVEFFAKLMQIQIKYTDLPLHNFVKQENIQFPKILIMSLEDKCPSLMETLNKKYGNHIVFNRASKNLIEGVSVYASKGIALKEFASRNGFKQEEIAAIGDAENDISMLQYAGLGIAVDNAMPNVKKAANVIVESNNDAGVAKAIYRYMLND